MKDVQNRVELASLEVHSAKPELKHLIGFLAILGRFAEIAISAAALVLSSPVMLIIAIIIRLDSPGAAIFCQTRIGKDLRPFAFYKFRTLYVDAKERFPHLYAYLYTPEEVQTLLFKREDDPRVTPAGKWLRVSTLDELPNFWNVLRGDMHLVGPRPEIPEMVQYYTQEQAIKFAVKPGITGLAQIRGRGRLSFQQTIAYDLEYVRNRSFLLDLKIILTTIKLLFTRDGAF